MRMKFLEEDSSVVRLDWDDLESLAWKVIFANGFGADLEIWDFEYITGAARIHQHPWGVDLARFPRPTDATAEDVWSWIMDHSSLVERQEWLHQRVKERLERQELEKLPILLAKARKAQSRDEWEGILSALCQELLKFGVLNAGEWIATMKNEHPYGDPFWSVQEEGRDMG